MEAQGQWEEFDSYIKTKFCFTQTLLMQTTNKHSFISFIRHVCVFKKEVNNFRSKSKVKSAACFGGSTFTFKLAYSLIDRPIMTVNK